MNNKLELKKEIINSRMQSINCIPMSYTKVSEGINSEVYKLESKQGNYVYKEYKLGKSSKDERIKAEVDFINHLQSNGIDQIPKLFNYRLDELWSIQSWEEGEKLEKPSLKDWEELYAFILVLQETKKSSSASSLPLAADARFDLLQSISLTKEKITDLRRLSEQSKELEILRNFLEKQIIPSFEQTENKIIQELSKSNIRYIKSDELIISPSDVGFHNVIKNNSNKYIFMDFEYAGWDAPSKLICDLILQPNHIQNNQMIDFTINHFKGKLISEKMISRIRILANIYRIKWVSIILNIAKKKKPGKYQLEIQINKAKEYFSETKDAIYYIENKLAK